MMFDARALAVASLCISSAGLMSTPASCEEASEDAAQAAAEAWLTVVDAGDYGESWEQTASLFKGAVTRDQWTQALDGVRSPLGDVLSRKVKSRQHTTQLPGAPDGQYVVLQFDTVFVNKAAAVETITPMIDKDGVWRVSGYFVK
jgi:hypothetical protein